MPATYYQGAQLTYDNSPTPSGNKIKYVYSWADALDPWITPFLNGIDKTTPINQRPFNWGQSARIGLASLVTDNPLLIGSTTVNVTTNTGVYFKGGNLLAITDFVAGTNRLDPNSREIVWIPMASTPAADAITITRAQNGTSAAQHNQGAVIEIIGVAEPEMADHTTDPVTRGFQVSNDFQRFAGGLRADKRAQNMPTYEHPDNPMMADFRDLQIKLKLELEKTILLSPGSQAGSGTTSPSTMAGMRKFITSNVTDLAGATIDGSTLESVVRGIKKKVEGGFATTLLAGYDTTAIWDTFLNPYRRADMQDGSINMTMDSIKTRWGTYSIGVSHNLPEGEIWLVDMGSMHYAPFAGLDWHIKRHEVNGDYDWISFSGDFTFILERESRMAVIRNFDTDLNSYPKFVFA